MKVYIWGTGRLASTLDNSVFKRHTVLGYIDNNADTKKEFNGNRVFHPKEIVQSNYDAILIATIHSDQIWNQCKELGISETKLLFLHNNMSMIDKNHNYTLLGDILGNDTAEIIKNRNQMIRRGANKGILVEDRLPERLLHYQNVDYVRIKTLELIVKELKKRNLHGNIAEFGVFRGEFAQFLNWYFPEKTLYLFDTFDGFDEKEFIKEKEQGNCERAFGDVFRETLVDDVLAKMSSPNNIKVFKGLFPDSLNGLEDKYSLVSIDVDFEDSIYNGLNYFFPRLEKGGYIFLHDYNDGLLLGVEKAIDRYESEHNLSLCKVPICDVAGSLIITK